MGRLIEVQYLPYLDDKNVYQTFQLIWIGDRLVAYWQTNMPGGTTSKRYVGTDESGRPIDMMSWPSSGSTTREWWVNPFAWGEMPVTDGVFQPIMFAGQYNDDETRALLGDGVTVHRPGLVRHNGNRRVYDPFSGNYLQSDYRLPNSWSSYTYARNNPLQQQSMTGLGYVARIVNIGGNRYDCDDSATIAEGPNGEIILEGGTCVLLEYDWEDDGPGGGGGPGGTSPCGLGGCPPGGGQDPGPGLDLQGNVPPQLEGEVDLEGDGDPTTQEPYHPWDDAPIDWWNPTALDVDCFSTTRKRLTCRLNCDDQELLDLANGVDELESGIKKLWCYRRCEYWYGGRCAN